MNIKEAREEIKNTVLAYTAKNPDGTYRIPMVRQRPVLLIGPPGIGKTAIMEQIAGECGIGLVAYTITHHTRQSAIGLPVIRTKEYDGETCQVTEYTMSEIIASVYNCMEKTGRKEGILFIDEINCVSETLAPAMLEFLQNKRFGSHQVPEGWVIAAAGNPQGFNNSVRDFDVVTLDRVRLLNVEENLDVFREFALKAGIHPAILTFLELKPQDFYRMERYEGGTWFVTARGWEDLSQTLQVYEDLKLPVTETLVEEFLQFPMVAREFCSFYKVYLENEGRYPIGAILKCAGTDGKTEEMSRIRENLAQAGRDERISFIYLLYAECCAAEDKGTVLSLAAKLAEECLNLNELRIFMKLIMTNPVTAGAIAENASGTIAKNAPGEAAGGQNPAINGSEKNDIWTRIAGRIRQTQDEEEYEELAGRLYEFVTGSQA